MSIREIKYTVKADGIDPSVKQFGGVQGDHRVSEVVFNINSKLYESLEAVALDKSGQLIYRIDGYNGAGEVIRSDTNKLSSDKVRYLLEESITRYGGLIRVVLVISLMANDLTEMELYSFPVVLQLKNLPTGAETEEKNRESMSVLAQVAKEASDAASAAAVKATEAIEEIRAKLANGEFKGEQGIQGPQGIQGEKGEKGETGNTGPQGPKGDSGVYVGSGDMPEGYNVQIDPDGDNSLEDEYIDYIEEIVIDELAKRGQLKPEFANSIEECTDTTKLYVLPDGYIYAYMSVFGEVELDMTDNVTWTDTKLVVSGNTYTEESSTIYIASNEIEVTSNKKYKFNMNELANDSIMNDSALDFNTSILILNSNKELIDYAQYLLKISNVNGDRIFDAEYTMPSNAAYIRFRCYTSENNNRAKYFKNYLKVTYESDTAFYQWANTGHAFVPANYEDKLIELEEKTEELENKITNIKSNDNIESYVVEEANRVIDAVLDAQGTRAFNIIAMTDLHNNGGESDTEIIHAYQGAGYIADRLKIDAFVNLGDHTDNFAHSSWLEGQTDMEMINSNCHKYLHNVDKLRLIGNHDFKEPYSSRVYKLISAFSKNVKWGNMLGGYFYKDYEDYKLRVICMNTSEVSQESIDAGQNATEPYMPTIEISDAQHNWFVETLDLSSKSDANEWQILIMSHVPLDYWGFKIPYILKAYLEGTSWSEGNVTCNFANKNKAGIIANIHGHIHNFKVEKLHLGSPNAAETIDIYRIAIPEVTEGYQNHYSDIPSWYDVSYPKVANTAQDTSFNILSIDLDNHCINAICYGAGIDRTIDYPVHEIEDTDIISSYEVDIASVGYTNDARWSVTSGDFASSGGSGYTAINLIPFTRETGQTTTIELTGIKWVNDSITAFLPFVDDNYIDTAAIYFEKSHDYSNDIGIKTICNDDSTITIIITNHPDGTIFNGFKVCGVGSGADAKITITISE